MAKKKAATKPKTDPDSDAATLSVETSDIGQNNLKLWRDVERTPPSMTKEVKYGPRKYTAVDPQWQLRVCTALWGPYGKNWGLDDLSYTVHDVTYLTKQKTPTGGQQEVSVTESVVVLRATFFYPTEKGETASFPIINDDKFKAGDEVMKKLVTNTRSKALSWLGFSADVYLGKFEDSAYVQETRTKFEGQNALVQKVMSKVAVAETLEQLAEYRDRLNRLIADRTLDDLAAARELLEIIAEKEQELVA